MATTIGRVDFTVDFDGSSLPAQARAIGKSMGATLGKSMRDNFDKETSALGRDLKSQMQKNGTLAGVTVVNAMKDIIARRRSELVNSLANIFSDRKIFSDFVQSTGDVNRGLEEIQQKLRAAREEGALSGAEFNRLNLTAMNWAQGIRTTQADREGLVADLRAMRLEAIDLGVGLDRTGESMERNATRTNVLATAFGNLRDRLRRTNKDSDTFFSRWREMPHGFRQATFYVALFASLGSQISGLGSAAGSSLVVLGVAATALGAGLAALLVGLNGVTGEMDKIAPAAQPAIQAFRDLGEPFRALQQSVQGELFGGLAPEIEKLANTLIPVLNVGLTGLATVLNQLFGEILSGLNEVGGGAILSPMETLLALFVGFQPILLALGQGFIQLFEALGQVAVVSLPYVQNFSDVFLDLMTQFNEWTSSVAGNAALNEFFANGTEIMGAVLPLLGAIADLFNSLVTPETVDLLVNTLGQLEQFMPALATLLGAIAILDPIGILATLLNELGKALTPLAGPMEEFARIINGALIKAIQDLAPLVGDVVGAFAPLLPIIAQLASDLLNQLTPALTPVFEALTQLGVALVPLIAQLIAGLMPAFTAVIGAIAPLLDAILPPLIELIPSLVESLLPLILSLVEVVVALAPVLTMFAELIGPLLGPLIELVIMLVDAALKPLADMITTFVVPAVTLVTDLLRDWMPVISAVIGAFGGLITFITSAFRGDWNAAWQGIGDFFEGVFESNLASIKAVINTIISLINNVIRQANASGKLIAGALGIGNVATIPLIKKMASGGLATTPLHALIGEAGPEAVVPLRRPLSQVDPSVRALSAIAQGKAYSGSDGSGKVINVAEGAIVISGVGDGRLAADAAVDRLVAEVAT